MPGLNHELVTGLVQVRKHHLSDVDAESLGALDGRAREVGLHRTAADLRLSPPGAGTALGRILCRAVERQTGITLEVAKLDRIRHHAKEDLALGELHLHAADPRRPVAAQCRQRCVLADGEAFPNTSRERRHAATTSAQLVIVPSSLDAARYSAPNHCRRMGKR